MTDEDKAIIVGILVVLVIVAGAFMALGHAGARCREAYGQDWRSMSSRDMTLCAGPTGELRAFPG